MIVRAPVPAIDVHTHLFPERLARAVRRALGEMYGWSFDLPDQPGLLAEVLAEHNVERFVLLPYAHKPGMARSLNTWIAETAASLPGAIGFACVHPDDDARGVLSEAFDLGLRGLKLHYQVQQIAPDDPRLDPVYEVMLEADLPIVAHAGRAPTDNGLVGADRFAAAMRKHPDLRICVAHMGAPETEEFVALLPRYPRLYLDTSGLGTTPMRRRWFEAAPERVLFGSDAPSIDHDLSLEITMITDLDLGPEIENRIFRENAREFLGHTL